MAGLLAHGAEVVGRLHQALAEMMLPEPVDHHPGQRADWPRGSTIRRASSSRPLPAVGTSPGPGRREPRGTAAARARPGFWWLPRIKTRSFSPSPSAIARASVGSGIVRLDRAILGQGDLQPAGQDGVAGAKVGCQRSSLDGRSARALCAAGGGSSADRTCDLIDRDEAVPVQPCGSGARRSRPWHRRRSRGRPGGPATSRRPG